MTNATNKKVPLKTKIFEAIKLEFTGWKVFEVTLLVITLAIIITLGCIADHPNPVMILAGTFSFLGVMLGAKGKISTFIVATIGSAFYIVANLQFGNLGSLIFHAAFGIPMNFISFGLWFKNRNQETGDVLPKRMSCQGLGVSFLTFIGVYLLCGFLWPVAENATVAQHWVDKLVFTVMIFAMIVMLFRFIDQWYLWILANIVNIVLWSVILVNVNQGGSYAESTSDKDAWIFIVNYVAALINSLYGTWNWFKMYRENPKYELKVLTTAEIQQLSTWNKVSYFANQFFTKPGH